MAKKYRDTDYLCLSAQIRSRENALLRRSQLDRMLESGDAKQAARILAEQGWESFDPTQPGALDAAILTQREALYRELSGQLPDDAVLAVFRLKYDCHNIKTLIKARGADVSALLLDAGTIPAQELAQRRRESEGWAFLPAPMAHAALDAERVLAETGDARRSDLLVDAACFARQLELAQASGCRILADYVRALIDGANLKSLVRTLRLKKDAAFLRELLLPGGTVSPERIVQHGFSSSAAELFAGSALAQAAQTAEAAAAGGSLTELERLCDNAALDVIGRARRVPFGVEVPVGYVAARENELMSVRLVITGLLAGIPADQIRERLRETNG